MRGFVTASKWLGNRMWQLILLTEVWFFFYNQSRHARTTHPTPQKRTTQKKDHRMRFWLSRRGFSPLCKPFPKGSRGRSGPAPGIQPWVTSGKFLELGALFPICKMGIMMTLTSQAHSQDHALGTVPSTWAMSAIISTSQPKAQTNGSRHWSCGPEPHIRYRTAKQTIPQAPQPLATRTAQTDEKQAHCLWHLAPGSDVSAQRGPRPSLSALQAHRLPDAVWHSSAPSSAAWVGNEHQPHPPANTFAVSCSHQWSL